MIPWINFAVLIISSFLFTVFYVKSVGPAADWPTAAKYPSGRVKIPRILDTAGGAASIAAETLGRSRDISWADAFRQPAWSIMFHLPPFDAKMLLAVLLGCLRAE